MTIKVGLIGCGGIAEEHLKGYLKLPREEAQVTAVCDVVAENAQRRSQEAGGVPIFSDFHTFVNEADVNAVDICLPHHLHKDAIVAAANAGKHIICEKPLCLTLDEAEAVEQAVKASGITLMCAHNQVFIPAVERVKALLNEGVFGKVYEIRTTDSFYHTFNPDNIGWRSQRSMMGGGELIDTGYHPSYLLLYLAGSVPVEVTAMISKHRLLFMDGEDSAQVLVRFASGAVGNIVTSWAYEPTANTEKFSLVAERGYAYSSKGFLHYKIRGSEPVTIELQGINTFQAEIAHFIASLRAGSKPVQTEVDGINVLKVILGAYQSSEEKRIVVL